MKIIESEAALVKSIDVDCSKHYGQYVTILFNRMKKLLDKPDFRIFSQTFDKEMGDKKFKDSDDFFKKSMNIKMMI